MPANEFVVVFMSCSNALGYLTSPCPVSPLPVPLLSSSKGLVALSSLAVPKGRCVSVVYQHWFPDLHSFSEFGSGSVSGVCVVAVPGSLPALSSETIRPTLSVSVLALRFFQSYVHLLTL